MAKDILTSIKEKVEDEGNEIGTPQYEFRLLALKVDKCMEMQSVTKCSECRAYLGCSLTRDHAMAKLYGPRKP